MRKLALTTTAAVFALGGAAAAQSSGLQPYVGAGGTYLFGDDVELGAATGRAGVDIGDYLGVEAEGSIGVEDDTLGGADVELDHLLAGFARLRAPVTPSLELFARGGYYTAETDVSAAGVTAGIDDDDIALGAGAEMMLGGPHSLRADYTNYGVDDDGHSGALSYVFRF